MVNSEWFAMVPSTCPVEAVLRERTPFTIHYSPFTRVRIKPRQEILP
jgi:hypothetical protein